jgi:Phage Mu protein F like protein.
MVVCNSCMKKTPDNSIYCIHCGAKIIRTLPDPKFSVSIHYKVDERAVSNFVEILNDNLAKVENKNQVIAALEAAERKGSEIAQLVKIFRSFVEVSEHDAETCMRTWSGQAHNKTAWQRTREYAPYKEWLPAPNSDRTRPSHGAMNGVIIPVDEYFVVPGFIDRFTKETIPEALMMYPGDVSRNPHKSQVCRCRCTLAPRFTNKKRK